MSKTKAPQREKSRRSALSRRLLFQYFLSLAGAAAALVLFVFIMVQLCAMFTWFPENPIYRFLKSIKDNILFVGLVLFAGLWVAITYRYITKPLRYLDDLIQAAEQLAAQPEEAIVLPDAMADTQNELNLAREQALHDAHAAKVAEQRKNDLIVYLAHDLKTPLTSVIGYLTLLRDEPLISQELRAKYTGIALEKAQRLEELINEFFDITRFNLTHLELNRERVNLTRMLEQITFEFQPTLDAKRLSWDMHLAPDVQLSCDPEKLERVFDNLFRNAVNYSYPDTQISVCLSANARNAVIQVKNHGKTIPPEKLNRIFEQFFRLDSSRSTVTGGAGLGLAIAKEIVELHNGTITAESSDESILFTVRLPV